MTTFLIALSLVFGLASLVAAKTSGTRLKLSVASLLILALAFLNDSTAPPTPRESEPVPAAVHQVQEP